MINKISNVAFNTYNNQNQVKKNSQPAFGINLKYGPIMESIEKEGKTPKHWEVLKHEFERFLNLLPPKNKTILMDVEHYPEHYAGEIVMKDADNTVVIGGSPLMVKRSGLVDADSPVEVLNNENPFLGSKITSWLKNQAYQFSHKFINDAKL